jgi:hypothetical protein
MPATSTKNTPLSSMASADLGIGNAGTPQMDEETEEERKRRMAQQQQQYMLASQNSMASTALLGSVNG